ncbi:MAG: hypothetical protein U0350_02255 [Caldilineaceae bacterium]
MSTYSLPDLLQRWSKGDLTADQAIGQLLQQLLILADRQTELDKRLRALEQPPRPQDGQHRGV